MSARRTFVDRVARPTPRTGGLLALSAPLLGLPLGLLPALLLAGCGGPTQGQRPSPASTASGRPAAPTTSAGENPGLDVAVAGWRDRVVTWRDLAPALIELGGATALRDAFLDQRIAQALADRSITVGADAIEAERRHLLASLDPDPNQATRLLDMIRTQQGLGPVRFEALLRRNAGLRALVQPEVRITEDGLARQHELLHGPKRVCRVIASPSIAEAEDIRRQLEGGADFAALAVRVSSDASAARGGLLAPISRVDPTWPEAFRSALFALGRGELSPPTLVDRAYLVVRLEDERPADGVTLAASRSEVEAALRQAQERVLMEEKARAYLGEVAPSIFHPGFDEAWRRSAR